MNGKKITVDQIVDLYDPERTGMKQVILIEDEKENILSTNSVMLWGIGHVPVVGIETDGKMLKLWLEDQAIREEWKRETS